jgi:hypothetical protein
VAGEDEDYGSARITIDLDDAGAVQDARDLGLRIQRALTRATRDTGNQIRRNIQRGLSAAAVSVRVEPDLSRFDAALLRGLRSLTSIDIPVAPDLTGFVERLRALLAGEEVSIRVVPDLDDFDARIRAHRPPDVTVTVDVDNDRLTRSLGGIAGLAGRVASSLGRLLTVGAVGIAMAGAATGVGAFVAALAPAAGAVAALPALFIGAKVAAGALQLALQGVSDALGDALSGDMEKFAKDLESLAPAAQTALRPLGEALRGLQQQLQQAFFKQFASETAGAIKNLSPLKAGVVAITEAFGEATREGLKFLQSQRALVQMRSILTGTASAVGGLAGGIQPLLQGVLDIAGEVSEAFGSRLGGAITSTSQRFGEFLSRTAESGRAVAAVEGAIAVFRQLGAVASNVGGIIGGVFQAGETAGAGFLANLETITGKLNEFVNSDVGQTAIAGVFQTIGQIAQQLGPILAAVVTQLGNIGPAVAPIFSELGPLIVGLVNSVGPALAALGAALAESFQGFSSEQLTIAFEQLGSAITSLAPALPPVVQAVAALARSTADLLEVLAPVAALLLQIVAPIVNFGAPVIVAAAGVLALVKAIRTAVVIFRLLQATWLAINAAFIATPIGATIVLIVGLVAAVYLLYQRFGLVRAAVDAVGRAIVTGFTAAINFLIGLPGLVGGALSSFGSTLVSIFTGAWETAKAAVSAGIDAVIGFFTALPGRIVAGLAALPGLLVDLFVNAVAFVGIALLTAIAGLIFIFFRLPTMIAEALVSLGPLLVNAFVAGFNATTAAISSWISSAVAFFAALPGRIVSAVTSLPGRLRSLFTSAGASALSAARSFGSSAVAFFTALPGRIASGLSSLGSKIGGAFTRAAGAARRAVSSLITNIVSLFKTLPNKIVDSLGNIGSRIVSKIKSGLPSSVRSVLPFANGGIVNSPVVGLVGEAGPEVIIPLTRPQRARQLAQESGLVDMLAKSGVLGKSTQSGGKRSGETVINNYWTLNEVGDAHMTASRVINRLTAAAVI